MNKNLLYISLKFFKADIGTGYLGTRKWFICYVFSYAEFENQG